MFVRILSFFRLIFVLPIRFYQKWISPLFPSSCIYTPTCSHYTEKAVLKHGVLIGLFLGFLRILRCQSLFFRGGNDPVPSKLSLDVFKAYVRFSKCTSPEDEESRGKSDQ